MVRNLLLGAGGLLLILNVGVFLSPDPQLKAAAEITSSFLGLAVILLAVNLATQKPAETPSTPVVTAPPPVPVPEPTPARAEAEIVAFLALLQEQGRLVDFVLEDAAAASDQQLGTAARVVHAGCRKVLADYFEIVPLHSGNEGDPVLLEAGYDSAAHRLLGTVAEHPPYKGKLLHPGWITRSVTLPRITGTTAQRPWPVLAPAEIEISG